jgi:hypothetical protein
VVAPGAAAGAAKLPLPVRPVTTREAIQTVVVVLTVLLYRNWSSSRASVLRLARRRRLAAPAPRRGDAGDDANDLSSG